jgi:uncharacterized membrane protein
MMKSTNDGSTQTSVAGPSWRTWVGVYFLATVVFGILDFVWLTQVGPLLYRPTLNEVLADQPRWQPALAFYLVYVFGITWFAIRPGLIERSVGLAGLNGLLFGAIAYATFDLTNQAVLRVWTTQITLIDIAWGSSATAATAMICTWFSQKPPLKGD